MELVLRQVDGRGRLNLEGIVTPGAHYTATPDADGAIVLSPVKVLTTAVKRTNDDGRDDPSLV